MSSQSFLWGSLTLSPPIFFFHAVTPLFVWLWVYHDVSFQFVPPDFLFQEGFNRGLWIEKALDKAMEVYTEYTCKKNATLLFPREKTVSYIADLKLAIPRRFVMEFSWGFLDAENWTDWNETACHSCHMQAQTALPQLLPPPMCFHHQPSPQLDSHLDCKVLPWQDHTTLGPGLTAWSL